MKILFILDSLVEAGAEKSTVEIAKKLKEFTPVFVYIYKGNTLQEELENEGIKVYGLDIDFKYGFSKAVNLLLPIYEKEKPAIIHSVLYRSDVIARKLKMKFPQIPLVGSFVNNSYTPLRYKNQTIISKLKLWMAYRLDKAMVKRVDFFISNSATIKKAEGKALGVPPEKIEVIYRGRDIEKYEIEDGRIQQVKNTLKLNNKNVLINVSRLISRKAQIDIIKAMPVVLLKYPNTVLLIVGSGDNEEYLRTEIKKLNLSNNVNLLGRRRDVPDLLAASDIFIYPSYAEGLPGALIEAMMSKKIIIASDIEENLECVNEDSALIFQRGNVKELSQKILIAIKNKDKLKKLGEEAKVQSNLKFDINSIADKYEKVYKEILKMN